MAIVCILPSCDEDECPRDGYQKIYYDSGELNGEGNFKNCCSDSIWRYYRRDGSLWYISSSRDCNPHGMNVYFDETGDTISAARFDQGTCYYYAVYDNRRRKTFLFDFAAQTLYIKESGGTAANIKINSTADYLEHNYLANGSLFVTSGWDIYVVGLNNKLLLNMRDTIEKYYPQELQKSGAALNWNVSRLYDTVSVRFYHSHLKNGDAQIKDWKYVF